MDSVDRARNLLPGNGDLRPQKDREMVFCELNQIRRRYQKGVVSKQFQKLERGSAFFVYGGMWITFPKNRKSGHYIPDKGFEILDFPCNQFANQAPGSEDEIHEFCTLKFGTDFPQFKKIDVNGETADPLFAYLATEKPFNGFGKGIKNAMLEKFAKMNNKQFGDKAYIKWNFTKFLIDREGRVVARFEPTVDMADVKKAVEEIL